MMAGFAGGAGQTPPDRRSTPRRAIIRDGMMGDTQLFSDLVQHAWRQHEAESQGRAELVQPPGQRGLVQRLDGAGNGVTRSLPRHIHLLLSDIYLHGWHAQAAHLRQRPDRRQVAGLRLANPLLVKLALP